MKSIRVLCLLLGMSVAGAASASQDDVFDAYTGVAVGISNLDIYNCTPDCGVGETNNPHMLGMKWGLIFRGWRERLLGVDVGAEIEWMQSVEMHIHEPGEIDDRLLALTAIARLPIQVSEQFVDGRIQPYLGFGFGSEVLNIMLDSGAGSCAHGGPVKMLGVRYMLTPQVGVNFEYRNFSTEHHNLLEARPEIAFEEFLETTMLGVSYHFD